MHSELTSVGIMKTGFGTSRKPFSGQPVNSRDSLETRAFIGINSEKIISVCSADWFSANHDMQIF